MISSDIIALALARVYGETAAKKVRDRVCSGVYEIDETVRLTGKLKVFDDYEATNHQRLNPLLLLAILLDGMPKQVRNARIREAVARLAAGEAPDISEIKAETDAAVAELMAATKAHAKGKAVFDGDVAVVMA